MLLLSLTHISASNVPNFMLLAPFSPRLVSLHMLFVLQLPEPVRVKARLKITSQMQINELWLTSYKLPKYRFIRYSREWRIHLNQFRGDVS